MTGEKQNRLFKTIAAIMSSVMIISTVTCIDLTAFAAEGTRQIVILHTNDIHGAMDSASAVYGSDGSVVAEPRIGIAAVAEYKQKMQKEYGKNNVDLVDVGDSMQGELIATVSEGMNVIRIMNDVGYDVAGLGNHEFDFGFDNFLKLIARAHFKYVCCNLKENSDNKTVLSPYTMIDHQGLKIAYIGIDTPSSFTTSTPKFFQDDNGNYLYTFCQDATGQALYNQVNRTVKAAKKSGADYVVALAHLGTRGSETRWSIDSVAENTCGIDLFLDGHSHEVYQRTVKNKKGEKTYITQAGTKTEHLGKVVLTVDNRTNKVKNIVTGTVEPKKKDKAVSDYVEKFDREVDSYMDTMVGYSKYDLVINDPTNPDNRLIRKRETNLGDFCADAYREVLDADVGLINGGNIRVELPAGNITLETLYSIFPYGNAPVKIKVTGRQLRDFLEFSYRKLPDNENGGFMHVSGMTFTVDTSIPSSAGEDIYGVFTSVTGDYRIRDIKINGKDIDLDLDAYYTVASCDYDVEDDGDGNTAFDGTEELAHGIETDADLLAEYIRNNLSGVIGDEYANPYGQGRMNIK